MADVIRFHHVQGRTEGVLALAAQLGEATGHTVLTPDLFEGRTFASIDEGSPRARSIGFGPLIERVSGPQMPFSPATRAIATCLPTAASRPTTRTRPRYS